MSTIRNTTSLSTLRTAASTLKKHFEKADANKDGRVTEWEIKRYAKDQHNARQVGTAMLTVFNWSLDERHTTANVQLVKQNVDAAVDLAKARDKNRNGKIDVGAELNSANRLKTFQALANLAGAGDVIPTGGTGLTAKKLGDAVSPWVRDAIYMSEGDYTPDTFTVAGTRTISASNLLSVLKGPIAGFYDEQDGDLSSYAVESAGTAKKFFSNMAGYATETESNEAWKAIGKLYGDNLSELKVFKVGPKADDGSLAVDQGLYAYVVVGKTVDGKTAGFLLGSAET